MPGPTIEYISMNYEEIKDDNTREDVFTFPREADPVREGDPLTFEALLEATAEGVEKSTPKLMEAIANGTFLVEGTGFEDFASGIEGDDFGL